MSNYSMDLVFDIIELAAGLYIIYNGIKMKQTGHVEGNGLVGKNINLAAAPDEAGYIKAMFPVYIVCGLIFAIVGAAVAKQMCALCLRIILQVQFLQRCNCIHAR